MRCFLLGREGGLVGRVGREGGLVQNRQRTF